MMVMMVPDLDYQMSERDVGYLDSGKSYALSMEVLDCFLGSRERFMLGTVFVFFLVLRILARRLHVDECWVWRF